LLDFWLAEPRMCKHFHIPLQSGMDLILKKMRRRYLTSWYQNRVERIKTSHPHAGIGADVIVGFPGESEDMFQETYDFLQQLPVSYLHVFTYSERPQTPAAGFEGFVEPRVRAERSERLRALSARKRRLFYESFQGMNINVLFEENRNPGCLTGLSDEYVRVSVASTEDLRNQIVSVRVTGVHEDECVGEVQRITAQRNFDIALKNVVAA
ncbi:MAG TPA: radical SAM protein, partial [Bacteroidota bacterium]|nr:radical SAM protein [Bacteroidota bacterium]